MALKFSFGGKTKKVALKDEFRDFEALQGLAARFAGCTPENVEISFVDRENDSMKIVDNDDVEYFFTCHEGKGSLPTLEVSLKDPSATLAPALSESMVSANQSSVLVKEESVKELDGKIKSLEQSLEQLKLSISSTTETPKPENVPKVTTQHFGITCDGCGASPLVGRRFKCLVCHDFDLCEACEAKGHPHPMVRLVAIGNHFLIEKMQRKFLKLSHRNVERAREGPRFGGFFSRHFPMRCPRFERRGCPVAEEIPKAEEPKIEKVVEERAPETPAEDPIETKRNFLRMVFESSKDEQLIEDMLEAFKTLPLEQFYEEVSKL